MTIGAFCQSWFGKKIVGASSAGAPLGMSSLRIGHCITPCIRRWGPFDGGITRGRSLEITNIACRILAYTTEKHTHQQAALPRSNKTPIAS
jgi:hypothetical protein